MQTGVFQMRRLFLVACAARVASPNRVPIVANVRDATIPPCSLMPFRIGAPTSSTRPARRCRSGARASAITRISSVGHTCVVCAVCGRHLRICSMVGVASVCRCAWAARVLFGCVRDLGRRGEATTTSQHGSRKTSSSGTCSLGSRQPESTGRPMGSCSKASNGGAHETLDAAPWFEPMAPELGFIGGKVQDKSRQCCIVLQERIVAPLAFAPEALGGNDGEY